MFAAAEKAAADYGGTATGSQTTGVARNTIVLAGGFRHRTWGAK
jgi:hypothetical protein